MTMEGSADGVLVKVEGLSCVFGSGDSLTRVLCDVDLTVGRSRTLGLVGESGSGNRLRYALESTLLARKYDAGGHSHRRLSISQIAAFAGAALISRTWQPRSTGSLRSGEFSFATTVGIAAGLNVMREFLPSWLPK